MSDRRPPAAHDSVSIHLLDSAQGHTLQTWRIAERSTITIGRSDDNDVVIADPHVSRLHATLVHQQGAWTLISLGRHGTLIDNRLVSEAELRSNVVFRLGPTGPMLRFDLGKLATSATATMDQIDPDAIAMFELDQERSKREADQIAGGALFDELLQESQRLRSARKAQEGSK
jgi:pSer/pThr/pTyr-binding forkhead associated (FHA) protein